MKRILIYTHDTYGLGNTRRMLAIARHLVQSDRNICVLMVSGSSMLHAFRHGPRIDYIKLPCLSRDIQGKYQSRYLDYDYEKLLQLRSDMITSAFASFQPDLVLVDKKPRGVGGELNQALIYMKERLPDSRCVLLLRDILDAPIRTAYIWHSRHYFDDIETFYDQVLVVGNRDVYDLCNEYQFPPSACNRLKYCGYLSREAGQTSRSELRRKYHIGDKPLLLAMAGGGEDGFTLLETVVQSLRLSPPRFKTLIVMGSEMPVDQQHQLGALVSSSLDVELLDFSDDMMSLIDASDLVISMAGYNTVCEFLTLNKPAIVVPRTEPSLEQWIRAQRMHELDILRAIHPDSLSPENVRTEINAMLKKPVYPLSSTVLDMNGLNNVTTSLLSLIAETDNSTALQMQAAEA